MKRTRFYLIMLVLLLPAIVVAQSNGEAACPAIVDAALEAADQFCHDTGRNQICYGNILLNATPQDGLPDFAFESAGDITSVSDIASVRISPLDEVAGTWGIAIMRLQANLPETLPGQNVTFILFGDVELINQVTADQVEAGDFTPMQSFYLTTGIGDARCREAPESGMLVQTPQGVGEISFVVNEVEVQLGSTVLFQAQTSRNLQVSTLEGAAVLQAKNSDEFYPVIAGTRFGMTIQQDGQRIIPIPELPEAYELGRLESLPLVLLDRPIEIHQPLTKYDLDELVARIETGEPLCGEDPFPSCDHFPEIAGGTPCTLPSLREDGIIGDRPLCAVELEAPEATEEAPQNAP